jgi:23S rRNA (adenine2503-C2)-methyltransferase
MREAFQAQLPEELATEGFDVRQLRKLAGAVHQRGLDDLGCQASLPNQVSYRLVAALGDRGRVGRLALVERQCSEVDPFEKYLLRAEDGALLEAVRIPLEKPGRFGICVSSQVGCALGCTYCRTGQGGLLRNLRAWEIVEQVRVVRRHLPPKTRISSVVFQGMGEPLGNYVAVRRAIDVLSHPAAQCIDQRSITVCTAGIPRPIEKLAQSGARVRLGLSLGSARPEVRRRLMPIEAQFPLVRVLPAVARFARSTGYAPMLAITLLSGVNTSRAEADALSRLILELGEAISRMPRLSLVTYNPIGENDPYQPATADEAERFRDWLCHDGFPVIRRYSGGSDIQAACGQLAARRMASGAPDPSSPEDPCSSRGEIPRRWVPNRVVEGS